MSSLGVALCTYNGEKYIVQQLDSILAQTLQPDLIVIVDDGSTDNTLAIVQTYAVSDTRFRIVQNRSNLGYVLNFEKAINLCNTDYIALSDQDDVWLPNKLELLLNEFERYPNAGMIFCNVEYMLEDGTRTGVTFADEHKNLILADVSTIKQFLLERKWGIAGNFIVLDARIKPHIFPNPYPITYGHDAWIAIYAYFFCEPRYVATPLSLYRLHPTMTSGAISCVLKNTPFAYKKKLFCRNRWFRNFKRLFTAPFTRKRRHRERLQREKQYAWDIVQTVIWLQEKHRQGCCQLSDFEQEKLDVIALAYRKVMSATAV